jgi:hypothetical protein
MGLRRKTAHDPELPLNVSCSATALDALLPPAVNALSDSDWPIAQAHRSSMGGSFYAVNGHRWPGAWSDEANPEAAKEPYSRGPLGRRLRTGEAHRRLCCRGAYAVLPLMVGR